MTKIIFKNHSLKIVLQIKLALKEKQRQLVKGKFSLPSHIQRHKELLEHQLHQFFPEHQYYNLPQHILTLSEKD